MKIIFVLSCSLISFLQSFAQINLELKYQLDSIQQLDSEIRMEVTKILNNQQYQDSVLRLNNSTLQDYVHVMLTRQEVFDQSNLRFVDSVITVHGYPGATLVGSPTNEVAWYVVQHSDQIEKHFELIKDAGKASEIPMYLVAKMQDRLLINQGKKQLYGTQASCEPNSDGEVICSLHPIKNHLFVNARRRNAGFDTTVDENAALLGVKVQSRKTHKDTLK